MAESSRGIHFLGTLPQFDDAQTAFAWQLDELQGQLRRLSGGETGPRLQWFVPMVKELQRLPKIRSRRTGNWTAYDDVDRLALRWGSRLSPHDIPLRLAVHAREELAQLDEAGKSASAELPLQVGVPGYLDMALFTFGPLGALRHASPFRRAVAREIAEIHAAGEDRVVFQLELPAELIAVASAPRPLRAPLAKLMARILTRQVADAPPGSRFGVHLCLGDLGHRAMQQLPTAEPLVRLTRAIVRQWPAGHPLEFVHLPMSGGDQPPVTDPDFYAPLRELRTTPDLPIVAGIAHEEQDESSQRAVRALVEEALGRQVDIATSCGLGRRTAEQAEAAVARMRMLLAP